LWPRLLDEVYRVVRDGEPRTPEGGERWQNVMLYKDDRPDVEVGVLAPRTFTPRDNVIASELPAGKAAMATHRGDYARLGTTHEAVLAYARANALRLAGPRWEIYGHWREDPRELETEIFWLLS
jgi:effector-binding domain-containing protein